MRSLSTANLPSGVPGAYRILANLVSLGKNPAFVGSLPRAGFAIGATCAAPRRTAARSERTHEGSSTGVSTLQTGLSAPTKYEAPVDAAPSATPPVHDFFSELGPGLITGAADDDPSGIATYFRCRRDVSGYGPLWTALFCFPLMAAVQLMWRRGWGMVTGLGLAAVVRRALFPNGVLWGCMSAVDRRQRDQHRRGSGWDGRTRPRW